MRVTPPRRSALRRTWETALRSRLESHLSSLIGRPVVEVVDFDFRFDLTNPWGRGLLASVRFLAGSSSVPAGSWRCRSPGNSSKRVY